MAAARFRTCAVGGVADTDSVEMQPVQPKSQLLAPLEARPTQLAVDRKVTANGTSDVV